MNDIIIGKVSKGSFKFPIEFQMFGNLQLTPNATFDTGYSHSLISAKNLNIGGFSIEELKVSALYDKNVNLSIGKGVESGVEIGDFNVKVSFNLANVKLIGMHIIKELYTKLFSYDNQIYLLAKKNCPNADMELNEARYKMEEFLKKCDFF